MEYLSAVYFWVNRERAAEIVRETSAAEFCTIMPSFCCSSGRIWVMDGEASYLCNENPKWQVAIFHNFVFSFRYRRCQIIVRNWVLKFGLIGLHVHEIYTTTFICLIFDGEFHWSPQSRQASLVESSMYFRYSAPEFLYFFLRHAHAQTQKNHVLVRGDGVLLCADRSTII